MDPPTKPLRLLSANDKALLKKYLDVALPPHAWASLGDKDHYPSFKDFWGEKGKAYTFFKLLLNRLITTSEGEGDSVATYTKIIDSLESTLTTFHKSKDNLYTSFFTRESYIDGIMKYVEYA